MKAIGHAELRTIDLPNALEFSMVSEDGWIGWIVWAAILLICLWMFWRINTPFARLIVLVICVAVAASFVASLLQGRETRLRVTSDELFAEGSLGKMFSTEVRIAASEVKSVGYEVGYEGEPSGLYVKHGRNRTCVLPGLDEAQGNTVASAIFLKFPEIGTEDTDIGSPLYGTKSELTTLGLSGRNPSDIDTRT